MVAVRVSVSLWRDAEAVRWRRSWQKRKLRIRVSFLSLAIDRIVS